MGAEVKTRDGADGFQGPNHEAATRGSSSSSRPENNKENRSNLDMPIRIGFEKRGTGKKSNKQVLLIVIGIDTYEKKAASSALAKRCEQFPIHSLISR